MKMGQGHSRQREQDNKRIKYKNNGINSRKETEYTNKRRNGLYSGG